MRLRLAALGAAATSGRIPASARFPDTAIALGIMADRSLALLVHPGDASTGHPGEFELAVQAFSRGATDLAARLTAHTRAWDRCRPALNRAAVRVRIPEGRADPTPSPGEPCSPSRTRL